MSKRMTAIAATALALAFGCEKGSNEEQSNPQDDEIVGQANLDENEASRDEQAADDTAFNQAPEVDIEGDLDDDMQDQDRIAQGPQTGRTQGQQRMGQQQQRPMGQQQGQMGQQQQLGQAHSPGQVVTAQSERNFNQTISQLTRQMRQNDLELVGQIRYDERARQRLMREQEGQSGSAQAGSQGASAQAGMGAAETGEEIGNVRLLVFRRPDAEMMSIESQGAEALLDAPRAVLVYERGGDVIVAYRAPEQMAAIGQEEPTGELLARVVRNATTTQQQPTASAEGTQRQQRTASAERTQREQGAQSGQDVDVNIGTDQGERADLGTSGVEDQRQARAQQTQRPMQ